MRNILPIAFFVLLAQPAFAHARLVKSVPEAGGRSTDVDKVILHFSERLEPAFSGAQLIDSAQKPVTAPSAIAGDSITLSTPDLKPGNYRVYWHSVGQDTHRMEGSFQFTVLP
jgi:methionine-rich copper-binding protein CopC